MDPQPLDGSEAFSRGYRIIAPDQPLSKNFRDAYWARVKQVLRHVFRGNEEEADAARKRVDDFQKDKGQSQTTFYHADPFEVAADLAGRRAKEITPEEKARYQEVLREAESQHNLPPEADVNSTHPEDV